jgi:hypothetical protein
MMRIVTWNLFSTCNMEYSVMKKIVNKIELYNPCILFIQNSQESYINNYITNNYNSMSRNGKHIIASKYPLNYIVTRSNANYSLNGLLNHPQIGNIAVVNNFSTIKYSDDSYDSIKKNIDYLDKLYPKIIGAGTIYQPFNQLKYDFENYRNFRLNDNEFTTCPLSYCQTDYIIHNFKLKTLPKYNTDICYYSPHKLFCLNLSKCW